MKIEKNQTMGNFRRAFQVLSLKDRQKIVVVVLLQVFIGILDLLGVIAIGLLGALSVTSIQAQPPGTQVAFALEFLQLSESSFQFQTLVLSIGAVVLMVGRTVISIVFTRRILFFLSNRGAAISATNP